MNIEVCEKLYGNLIKEDENFCFFEGKGKFGVTIPKNIYFYCQPERLNDSTRVGCESLNSCESMREESEEVSPPNPIKGKGHEK